MLMGGLSKLMLFILVAKLVPFGPSHVEFLVHENVLIETVDTNMVLTFIGTEVGWDFEFKLLMLKLKFIATEVSLE